jgi:hypothetical protein
MLRLKGWRNGILPASCEARVHVSWIVPRSQAPSASFGLKACAHRDFRHSPFCFQTSTNRARSLSHSLDLYDVLHASEFGIPCDLHAIMHVSGR